MDDSATSLLPLVTFFMSYEELPIKCQRDLNGVMRMELRIPNIPTDPNAAAFPEQHATHRADAAIARSRRYGRMRAQGRYG